MGPERVAYEPNEGPRSLEEALAALASRQHGVVSLAQLIELGFTRSAVRRRVQVGRLTRLHAGVFAVGHRALSSCSRDLAAVLSCGPQALLSHRSAAHLWAIRRMSSARIEVTAPRGRKPRRGILVHRSRLIHLDDRAVVDAIPVTSVARTVVDLADVLTEPQLVAALRESEVLRVLDLAALERTRARLPGRRGRRRLERVLADHRPEPHFTRSEAERHLLEICAEHGLPQPSVNVSIAGHEVDLFWPDARLAIEFDSAAFHHTRAAFHADRRRDRKLAALGIQVNRVTWPDYRDRAGLAAELKAIRASRLHAAG